MSFQEDLNTLHNFLMQTSESNLKRMLVDAKMTDAHLRLLIKIAKSSGHEELKACIENKTFPRVKFSPVESKLKETFWDVCLATLQSRGLLGAVPVAQTPAAATVSAEPVKKVA
jgi:hypothetical protein